jgi:hypothetical protein
MSTTLRFAWRADPVSVTPSGACRGETPLRDAPRPDRGIVSLRARLAANERVL